MTGSHEQLEQLSAYLDGELPHAERAALEEHLASCATCTETLGGLRATVADLRALPVPEPSAQDSWALRAAINRARVADRGPSPAQRLAVRVSSVAAALVLIGGSAVFLTRGGEQRVEDAAPPPATADSLRLAEVEVIEQPFDNAAARALIEEANAPLPASGAAPLEDRSSSFSAEASGSIGLDAIERCEADLFDRQSSERVPVRYIAAPYEEVDAFLLLYEVPSLDRLELWVVARADCRNVLLFEQRTTP